MTRARLRYPVLLAVMILALATLPRTARGAAMADYCQVPPFVIQNVVPNVMLLVSNSASMLEFAYHPAGELCTDGTVDSRCGAAGHGPYVDSAANPYYGYFDSRYWYSYGSNRFTPTAPKTGTGLTGARGKLSTEWDGNFLNWLTMRKTDVLRKVLTGGNVSGGVFGSQIADSSARGLYKQFTDTNYFWSPYNRNSALTVDFTTGGASTAPQFNVRNTSGASINDWYTVNVVNVPGTTVEGVIQDTIGARARLGLTFFNSDSDGGHVEPPIGFTALSSVVNRINTPSNINAGPSQPLGETLWGIAGYYAQEATSADMGMAACSFAPSCGPKWHNGDYLTTEPSKDPFNYGGVLYPPCAKSFVVVISDGVSCGDGKLPDNIVDYAGGRSSYNCTGSTCWAYGPFPGQTLPDWCGIGGNTAGFEDVALWAHTTDLRSPTIGSTNIERMQNLNMYVIQAFGTGSTLLKYAAINGGFEDANGSGTPDNTAEWDANGDGKPDTYYAASNGRELEDALRDAFSSILRRASSGTAASVLASGEGSGANLVQAVFYPRRRFGNDVITWTGSLQNLWYFTDPYLANAAIHEDTDGNAILNLANDYLAQYFYDTVTDTTKIRLFRTNAAGAIDNTFTPVIIPFEQAKALWEAGKLLYLRSPGDRKIFTIDNVNVANPTHIDFTTGNQSALTAPLAAPDLNGINGNTDETTGLIYYVRGTDPASYDPNSDGVPDLRQRKVVIDNTFAVWKLGDIIHSTPRISGATPLNGYYKAYQDPTYKAFTDNTNYRSRGWVFAGANDGMLHAFKLGKLEFDWTGRGSGDRAKLSNFDNAAQAIGAEVWGFIPRNALPYLQYTALADYCHLYYVDLSPFLFDASIGGGPNDVRTQADWRTILIGGMRTGGACRNATASCNGGTSDCVKTPVADLGYSSYFAIDITDTANPRVLWEFSHPQLGFATSGPAVVRIHGVDPSTGPPAQPDRTRNGNWYVIFGSGPTGPVDNTYNQFLARSDQDLRFFVLDLKTGALRATIDGTTVPNGFAGSMLNATADFELDYQDDAVFVGYVKKDAGTGTWTKGGVGRIVTGGDPDPANWAFSKVIDDPSVGAPTVGPVTSAVVRLQNNLSGTNWIFFGSGRYYYVRGSEVDAATGQHRLFGIKDPCYKNNAKLYPTCTASATVADLHDQTVIDNTVTEGIADGAGFNGWFIDLASDTTNPFDYGDGSHVYFSEREITDPLSVAGTGTVFFTTYRPYNEACSLGGKSFIWATQYNTGGAPNPYALLGKALIQVSTAAVEQVDLTTAFGGPNSRGGRMSTAIEGVPPIYQGLSILTPPPPSRKVLHMREH